MNRLYLTLLIAVLPITLMAAQDISKDVQEPEQKPESLIGLTLASAIGELGVPAEVYAVRGRAPAYDDVVFFYSSYIYLYWFENRVWQVRCDKRFSGTVAGLSLGMSGAAVRDILGPPLSVDGDSYYYDLPNRGFPVRLRIETKDGVVEDVYVYRSDF